MNPNDRQVAGNHYRATIQHWDYVITALDNRYLEGNITKYVTRHRKKNGIQDLQKAMHYLDKLQTEHEAGRIKPIVHSPPGTVNIAEFVAGNRLNGAEADVCMRLTMWRGSKDLESVRQFIRELIRNEEDRQRREDAEKCGFPGTGYVNQG